MTIGEKNQVWLYFATFYAVQSTIEPSTLHDSTLADESFSFNRADKSQEGASTCECVFERVCAFVCVTQELLSTQLVFSPV